ncbi:hypothetical protein B0H13DRAFT_2683538 [Mycena leptocephala]|nr:hypothetical protein B0H13DRAFT_2683538 [Mycena leptocephala]
MACTAMPPAMSCDVSLAAMCAACLPDGHVFPVVGGEKPEDGGDGDAAYVYDPATPRPRLALAIAIVERLRCFLRCPEPETGGEPGGRGRSFWMARLAAYECSFGRLVLMKCWCRSRARLGGSWSCWRWCSFCAALIGAGPMLVLGGPCCHASLLASFPLKLRLRFLGLRFFLVRVCVCVCMFIAACRSSSTFR